MDDRTTAALDALEIAAARALTHPALAGLELWVDRDDRGAFLGSLTLRVRDVLPPDVGEIATPKKPPRRKLLGHGKKPRA